MRLRHRRLESPDINLTPLLDVVFNLLIFFMVTTTFNKNAELNIQLPEATARAPQEQPRSVEVAIDAAGHYFVDGRALANEQSATLKEALRRAVAAGKAKEPVVVINADAQTRHQAVIEVMDVARQLGLLKLNFTARLVTEPKH